MATITSAQTGLWNTPSTWVGGVVPDLSQDNAIIASSHTVTMQDTSFTLRNGHFITIQAGGRLSVKSPLSVLGSSLINVYGILYDYVNVTLTLSEGSTVTNNGLVVIDGDLVIEDGASVSVISGGNIYVGGNVTVTGYGASLGVNSSYMWLYNSGVIEATDYGLINFGVYTNANLYGMLRVFPAGFLTLGNGAQVRVHNNIEISGVKTAEGGEIKMMRREGKFKDSEGRSLFVLNQVYGYLNAVA